HEIGHGIGLLHPCEIDGAQGAPDCASDPSYALTTMFPVYSASQAKLSADDVAGVCFLYPGMPGPACGATGCPVGTVCRPEGCVAMCGTEMCKADEYCTPDGCWPKDKCWGPLCKLTCAADSDCRARQKCVTSQCVGVAPDGDPCVSSADCAGGIC